MPLFSQASLQAWLNLPLAWHTPVWDRRRCQACSFLSHVEKDTTQGLSPHEAWVLQRPDDNARNVRAGTGREEGSDGREGRDAEKVSAGIKKEA